MAKQCAFNGCTFNVYSNEYCQRHQSSRTDANWLKRLETHFNRKPTERIRGSVKPINKESKKRAEINGKLYEPRARAFRKREGKCKVCPILRNAGIATNCSGKAEAVHHVKGKVTIELLLDELFWMPSCFWGNGWIEDNSKKAEELQLKLPDYESKLSKFKKT